MSRKLPKNRKQWLAEFRVVVDQSIETHTWTRLLNHLVQMGVTDPVGTIDDSEMTPELQRYYNYRIYDMLDGAWIFLRKALQADLMTTSELEGDGRICHKAYASELLENFLVQEPTWT